MEHKTKQYFRGRLGVGALLTGVLAGPVAWSLQFLVNYVAATHLCGSRFSGILHVVSLVAFAMAACGLLLAYRCWVRAGRPTTTLGPSVLGRTRMLSLGGMAISSFYLIVIVVQGLPNFMLDPCAR